MAATATPQVSSDLQTMIWKIVTDQALATFKSPDDVLAWQSFQGELDRRHETQARQPGGG